MASASPSGDSSLRISVPGSISNLGPGFDALSVAVELYLTLDVTAIDTAAPDRLTCAFAGGPPLVGENRIARAFALARERFGAPTPGVSVRIRTDIPMRAGLGSSAAATIAGFRLYEAFTEPRSAGDWLALACDIEGHPDNAAAALLGGLTLSCQTDDGQVLGRAWAWPSDLRFVVATPAAELETAVARKALPDTLSLRDAVFNLQRALLLVRALADGRYDDLREALRDRWHQPTRQAFVPGLADALALDHPAVLGVCLSGSGPSIAVLAAGRYAEAEAQLDGIYKRLGVPCTIRTLSAHQPTAS